MTIQIALLVGLVVNALLIFVSLWSDRATRKKLERLRAITETNTLCLGGLSHRLELLIDDRKIISQPVPKCPNCGNKKGVVGFSPTTVSCRDCGDTFNTGHRTTGAEELRRSAGGPTDKVSMETDGPVESILPPFYRVPS